MPSGVKAMFQKLHPAFPLDNKQWGRGNKQTNIDHKIMHMKQLKARILSKVIIFWWKKIMKDVFITATSISNI